MLERPHVQPDNSRPLVCPYCHDRFEEDEPRWVCPRCSTAHHEDCVQDNGACTVFGCVTTVPRAHPRDPRAIDDLPLDLDAVVQEARLRHAQAEERRQAQEPTPEQRREAERAARRRARRLARRYNPETRTPPRTVPTGEDTNPGSNLTSLVRLLVFVGLLLLVTVIGALISGGAGSSTASLPARGPFPPPFRRGY